MFIPDMDAIAYVFVYLTGPKDQYTTQGYGTTVGVGAGLLVLGVIIGSVLMWLVLRAVFTFRLAFVQGASYVSI